MVHPLDWNSIEVTVLLHHNIRVHPWNLVSPEKHCPTPLVVSLEPHDTINEPMLVSNIIIIHLEVVVVAQIPTEEGVVERLLQVVTPHFLWLASMTHSHCCEGSCKKVLIVAWCYDQIRQTTVTLQHCCLHGAPCLIGSPPSLLLLHDARRTTLSTLPQNSVGENWVEKQIHKLCKFDWVKKLSILQRWLDLHRFINMWRSRQCMGQ
jgi:hypothetical protein